MLDKTKKLIKETALKTKCAAKSFGDTYTHLSKVETENVNLSKLVAYYQKKEMVEQQAIEGFFTGIDEDGNPYPEDDEMHHVWNATYFYVEDRYNDKFEKDLKNLEKNKDL